MRTGKAICTLMLLSPVLAELLTASIPILQFLRPGTLIFLLALGYGIPVLLIRELAVRWRLSSAGIFILGIAYGILNEGLWAKTFLLDSNLPLPGFGHYGYILGISFPWAVTISFWHALVAVLFPIQFTDALFPGERNKPWLNRFLAFFLAAAVLLLASVNFLKATRRQGTAGELALLAAIMVFCGLLAGRFRIGNDVEPMALKSSKAAAWLGAATTFIPLIASGLAGARIPVLLFFALFTLMIGGYAAILKVFRLTSMQSLVLVGLGYCLTSTMLGVLARCLKKSAALETLVNGLVVEGIVVACLVRMRRSVPALASGHVAE